MVLTTLFAALAVVQNPVTYTLDIPVGLTTTFVQSGEKKISANFNDASLKDVLNFLRKQKVDFAVDPDQFKDRRISLSLTDVPVSTALSAIASALNAHWESTGGVKILKKGAGFSGGFQGGTEFFPKGFGSQNLQFKGFDKAQGEEIKKAMEEARKSIVDQKFDLKGLDFKGMDKAQSEEIQKALEEARKAMANQKFEFKGFDKAQSEEMKKAMDQMRKSMANQKFDFKTFDGKDWPKGGFVIKGQNFAELQKSITPAQKELQKNQGFLKISDLTPEQKKLAGISGEGKGTVEITITRDGETLKIKGE